MLHCRSSIAQTTVFIWLGSDGQTAVNLMFFEEKKFTVRFKLMDHTETPHSTSDQEMYRQDGCSLFKFKDGEIINKGSVFSYFSHEGRLSMV